MILCCVLLAVPALMMAQPHFEITPFGGYVFPARWNAVDGSVYFHGNAQYGGMFSVGFSRVMDVDFTYNRIDTKADIDTYGYATGHTDVSENFYLLGVTKNFRVSPVVSPFAGFKMGGVYMAPKDSRLYSYWFFAMGADAGVKVYFSKVVGLKLSAQLLMPVQGGGFTFYYGSAGGGGGAYVTSTLFDFGFNGGLIFRIGAIN